nr:MAG: hypothetical protein [Bacteriophage sp.]
MFYAPFRPHSLFMVKNKRARVFTLCTLFFSAVSYKKRKSAEAL